MALVKPAGSDFFAGEWRLQGCTGQTLSSIREFLCVSAVKTVFMDKH
jgi:hypothetical protein